MSPPRKKKTTRKPPQPPGELLELPETGQGQTVRNATDENLRSYAFSEEGFARLKELTKAKKQTLSRVVDDLVREDALKGWPSGPHPPWLRAKIAAREKHGSDPAELECALVNFVNAGDSELAVPSLYSTRWTLITLRCESHLERPAP